MLLDLFRSSAAWNHLEVVEEFQPLQSSTEHECVYHYSLVSDATHLGSVVDRMSCGSPLAGGKVSNDGNQTQLNSMRLVGESSTLLGALDSTMMVRVDAER